MISLTSKVKQKVKTKQKLGSKLRFKPAVLAVVLAVGFVLMPLVAGADRFSSQIQELNQENSEIQAQSRTLQLEAANLQEAIDGLRRQIAGLEAQIQASNAQIAKTEAKIAEAEAELERQKDMLAQNIRAMYLEGDISTLEMLASSKDLSEFVDKQQYRNSIEAKISDTLKKVTALRVQLKEEKERLEAQKKDQEERQKQLDIQRAEHARLLNLNEAQRTALNNELKQNNARIAELRRLQAIENARLFGSTPGSGPACGGGYPGSAPGPWGRWGCHYPLDYSIDTWGMYNRECVSYTAFKVAASGRHMPYWGGRGNANRWDDNARAAGIPVDRNPRPGDVAISNAGFYGHAMYVEHVYDDGRILISQYNGDWKGTYSTAVINRGNLVFIHFP